MTADQIRQLRPRLDEYLSLCDDCFAHANTRAHLATYVAGQLSDLHRKSVEPIALEAGVPPKTLQQFLSLLKWDHARLRDRLQRAVAREHKSRRAVAIIDDTACPKQGNKTPGVKRQWCNVRGKTDNCVVTVHLAYAVGDLHCLLDGELYLPEDWADDRDRCRAAAIPDALTYRPKWRIALELLDIASANGVRFPWLTCDEDYGGKPGFLQGLAERSLRDVAEVPGNATGWLEAPRVTRRPYRKGGKGKGRKVPRLVAGSTGARSVADHLGGSPALRDQAWVAYRVKEGTKGPMVWEA
jgi:SRSO17 transposase